jgi:hypothetical protein
MKLHELLAFEKGVRKRSQAEMTEAHRQSADERLCSGLVKRYEPAEDGGVQYPTERVPVTVRFSEAIRRFSDAWAAEVDVVSRKDRANLTALADVEVEGRALLSGVPATQLLFLEKQLEHVRTLLEKMAELPVGVSWQYEGSSGLHRSDERLTQRTEKLQTPIVLYDATEKHPAQTQLITKDVVVGHWYTTNYSGGVPAEQKRAMVARLDRLANAVKTARERANTVEVPAEGSEGAAMLRYIFGD